MRCSVVLVASLSVAACAQVSARSPSIFVQDSKEELAVGETVLVGGSWAASCQDPIPKKDGSHYTHACHEDEIALRVVCHAPCNVQPVDADSATVAPKQPGPFSFDVTIENLRSKETSTVRSRTFTVK